MKSAVWIVLGCGLLGGCTTAGMQQQRQQEQRRAANVQELRVAVERMEHRVAGLRQEQEVLGQDLADVRAALQQYQGQQDTAWAGIVARMEAQDRAREALRMELADELSRKMAELLQAQVRAQGGPTQRGAGGNLSQVGYEHEVQPGETLSEIARAYGVSAAAIIGANQMPNPDVLRAGQVLFIPQQGR